MKWVPLKVVILARANGFAVDSWAVKWKWSPATFLWHAVKGSQFEGTRSLSCVHRDPEILGINRFRSPPVLAVLIELTC